MHSPPPAIFSSWITQQLIFDDDDDDDFIAANLLQIPALQLINEPPIKHGGSRPGRSANVKRNIASGHDNIMRDYLGPRPIYGEGIFRRRFRMPRCLFLQIVDAIGAADPLMRQRVDATKKPDLTCLQKCTAAIRLLAYGMSADSLDEYVRIGESTALSYLRRFCHAINDIYGGEYFRSPRPDEVSHYLDINKKRGWPGLFGSIDCMHWEWKNCPYAWQGEFQGRKGLRSIVLEAVATPDLRNWSYFFGMPGSCNDLNILDRSPFLTDLIEVDSYKTDYVVNGRTRKRVYFLADGIYPELTCFVQTIAQPANAKESLFATSQEAIRKDVERCFGVLQARFEIIRKPSKLWHKESLELIIKTCVILHNLILTYENKHGLAPSISVEDVGRSLPRACLPFVDLVSGLVGLRDAAEHQQLRNDLVEHLWSVHGSQFGESV